MNQELAERAEARQESIAAFRWTRLRALLMLLPFMAAAGLGIWVFQGRSDIELWGYGPEKLVFIAFGVGAVSLIAFFFVWRCPMCGTSFGFQRGFALAFCRRCGAVFTEAPRGTGASSAAQLRGQVDAAVKRDLERYRARIGVRLMRGLALLVIGTLIAIFARPGDGPHKPDAVLLNRLGVHGATLAIIAMGSALALLGLLLIVWAYHGLNTGAARREQRTREFLGRQ